MILSHVLVLLNFVRNKPVVFHRKSCFTSSIPFSESCSQSLPVFPMFLRRHTLSFKAGRLDFLVDSPRLSLTLKGSLMASLIPAPRELDPRILTPNRNVLFVVLLEISVI
ncbi:hypothetical protein V8G54_022000 [Vigna mungo]|uniref:Uncharacterized protein n=1 Tax=Vigna mungo TaxID=3915 RepID=A0AAQ3NED9_VIGMU